MGKINLLRFISIFLIFVGTTTFGQTPWSGVYGNEWLSGKYDQPWLKINVNQKGIQKVTLPDAFKNKAGQLHLYHRGIEVPLTDVSASEIQFYGILNDGSSDALLYRPYTGIRANPYYSWFSDKGSYFLTYSNTPSKALEEQQLLPASGSPEQYHLQKLITAYSDDFTNDERTNIVLIALDQSYFSDGKAPTGRLLWKTKTKDSTYIGDPIFSFPYALTNLVDQVAKKPEIEVLLNGRTFSNNKIRVSVGKATTSLRDYSSLVEFSGFIPYKKSFELNTSTDVDETGKGFFQMENTTVTNAYSTTGAFSVTYIKLTYPQSFDMSNIKSATFNLTATTGSSSVVNIPNAPQNSKVYDITNADNPKLIKSNSLGNSLQVVVKRESNAELVLFVTSENTVVASSDISSVTFKDNKPADYDFLIVSNDNLKESADKYAAYRNSTEGGGYHSLSVNISDIYNQFNYGEPSPVAIRRFSDYMIHNSIRSKHNLLLIGPSTTIQSKLKLNRELRDEVPTIGYPGSDILLVEGLVTGYKDVPTIPIGRINATSGDQVINYLNKVKYYEATENAFSWKKNVLHLNGGKSAGEISQFRSLLASLVPVVEKGTIGGNVTPFVKQSTIEVEKANITPEVNAGVGMISYLGHGDPSVTDFDIGYVTDAANSYNNSGKYPLLYFNGCGVGNIFSGRHNASPNASDRIPLSSDWTNASDKGAIAVVSNTYYSFPGTSENYLKQLYNYIFGDKASSSFSIGMIQQLASKNILSQGYSDYDVANIHQSLLQGDPSMKLLWVNEPDLSIDTQEGIKIFSVPNNVSIGNSKSISTQFIISNGGKYSKDLKIPVQLIYIYTDGSKVIKRIDYPSVAYQDTLYYSIENTKPLQSVEVLIDPDNVINELSEKNNVSELSVDWNVAKDVTVYPVGKVKDVIAPILKVTFNNIILENDQVISPKPKIVFLLTDDVILPKDTTLIDIFIKPCVDNTCDFKRISYSSGKLILSTVSNKFLQIAYVADNLLEGEYELLASSKDAGGNVSLQPYRIRFSISKEDLIASVSIYPNPASEYVHFKMNAAPDHISSIKWKIYDLQGHLIVENIVQEGLSEWYWSPKVVSGLYIYKVTTTNKSNEEKVSTGKIALVR